jgi:peptidyl-prolyl cis-trans isomerase SurA
MRKIFIFLAYAIIFLLTSANSPAAVVDRIVALVNNDVITLSELEETGKKLFDQVKNSTLPDERPAKMRKAREEVLEELIDDKLLEQEIKERKIEISDREVDDAIQNVMRSNKLTENELKSVLAKDGLTYSAYQQNIRKELEKMRLINREIKSKIVIQDDSIYRYYQEHLQQFTDPTEIKVQQIFFFVPRPASDEKVAEIRKQASAILEKARKGEDFAELARKYSQGPEASAGGVLGYFKRHEMLPELDEVAFRLKVGQISDLTRCPEGFHILRVLEQKGGTPKPFAAVRDKIRSHMVQVQAQKKFDEWIKSLKAKAYIEKRL